MEVTDSATELYRLLSRTKAAGNSNAPTMVALINNAFKLQAPELVALRFSLIHVLTRRIQTLEQQVTTSRRIPEDLKEEALKHIQALKSGFEAQALSEPWSGTKAKSFNDSILEAIHFLGSGLRSEFPIRKLTEEDIETITREIDKITASLADDTLNLAIRDVLKNIRTTVEHYDYFGAESLVDQSIEGFAFVQACRKKRTDSGRDSFLKTAVLLYGILRFFADAAIYTDSLIQSTGNWNARLHLVVDYLATEQPPEPLSLPSSRQALLPPPPRSAKPVEGRDQEVDPEASTSEAR